MVVQMGEEPLAYGSYPGGESGNPGSRYFASGIPSWAAGRYHRLLLLRSPRQDDPALQFTQILQPR
jgi:penicillin amidase